jgi:hypothetical protein
VESIIQWDSSVKIFEMIPANESSENPIIISYDSYFLRWFFAVEADDILLNVNATN